MSDYQSSFHVIDLKHDIELSLTPQQPAADSEVAAGCAALPTAHCTVESIGGAY